MIAPAVKMSPIATRSAGGLNPPPIATRGAITKQKAAFGSIWMHEGFGVARMR